MMHTEMETQIHYLEQVAYSSVLRAFKAQSDALTWEKEGLITELRKELRVSDDEHRELLAKVNADDIILSIREWRNSGGNSNIMFSIPQSVHDTILPSPPGSMSRKRQKTSTPLSVHSQAPSVFGSLVKTPRPSPRFPPVARTPRGILSNHGGSAFPLTNNSDVGVRDPLIGRKVFTRWPDDNNFYAATIYDYNPNQGRHCLAYDKDTYEWVNLKEIAPQDIRWADEDQLSSHQSGHGRPGGGPGRGIRNQNSHDVVPTVERGRADQFDKGFPPMQNGIATNDADEIEILHTDTLIKEVEKVFDTSHPDLAEIEKAKKMLKDHERALVDVIAKLADASDSESDSDCATYIQEWRAAIYIQGQTMNDNQGTRRLQYSASGGRRPDGSTMGRIRLTPNDSQHEEHIDIL